MFRSLSRPRRTPKPAPFRPRLEELEGRCVPNASRVYDGAGNLTYFVVYRSAAGVGGDLWRYDASGAHFVFHEVLSVHAFKDPQGQLGFDVVFFFTFSQGGIVTGAWVEYDSSGGRLLGGGYRSAAASYDNLGNKTIDVVNAQGIWTEYDNASPGGRIMGDNILHAVTTFDPLGNKTIDVVYKSFVSQPGVIIQDEWVVYDATGSHDEGGGGTTSGAPTGISSVESTFDPAGQAIKDVIYTNGSWTYFDSTGAHPFGGPGFVL
jgi:hypothetical protein